jgi:hypothetical protein
MGVRSRGGGLTDGRLSGNSEAGAALNNFRPLLVSRPEPGNGSKKFRDLFRTLQFFHRLFWVKTMLSAILLLMLHARRVAAVPVQRSHLMRREPGRPQIARCLRSALA